MTVLGRLPRSSVWALIAVVIPAVIVAVLGLVSLRQWAASSELLFREQARDMATMAVDKIQMVLRQSEDDVLAELQARVGASGAQPAVLDEFLGRVPLVQRLYLFDRQGLLVYPERAHDADAAVFAALLAEVSQGRWEQGGRRDVIVGEQSLLTTLLKGPDGGPLLAALTRSVDGLRREVLDKTFKALEAPTICAVIDREGRPVYSSDGLDRADLVVVVPFRDGLSHWRLALYQPPGGSPREAVRRQVVLFMAAFAVLIGLIGVGIVATWRLVRRETEMARLKSDFVANVSHDLKTPVSVIRMFGETLEMGRVVDEPSRREYYRVITRESERLSRLIDNVLDFSRIEGGRRRYERVPTAVEPLVRDTLDAFSYPLMHGGFKLEVDVAPDLPAVPLDADAVGRALANLIDNAIKYSGDRRVVRVEARVVGDGLALTVADEGLGIPAAEQPRIFEKFYRVGRSETQGRRGSGVGLALVRHVTEAHGGRITVESEPGAGSRFTLWLPVRGPETR